MSLLFNAVKASERLFKPLRLQRYNKKMTHANICVIFLDFPDSLEYLEVLEILDFLEYLEVLEILECLVFPEFPD